MKLAGRLLLASLIAHFCQDNVPHAKAALMYPGLGKLPLAPVPIEFPSPDRPGRLHITPPRPMTPVIPSVIFRPPSEVLRNFGEMTPYNQLNTVPTEDSQDPVPTVRTKSISQQPDGSRARDPGPPPERPTRRQALGW